MKKIKVKLIIIGILVLLIGTAIGLYFLLPNKTNNQEAIEEPEIIEIKEEEPTNEKWKQYKNINDDYVCSVSFDSGLLDEPVLQAKGSLENYEFYAFKSKTPVTNYESGCESGPCTLNDVYLRKDINGEYELGGTVFMDYRNNLDDQNIIIYGHLYPLSMDPNKEIMFSPLEKLLKKENYEANKDITLLLSNEERHYEVVYVYLFDTTSNDYNDLQYYRTYYEYDYYDELDEGYYQTYIDNMEKKKVYDTGKALTTDDNTLTLQTCYEGNDNLVEIVVAREVK